MNADLALRRARAHRLLRAALLWEERRALERKLLEAAGADALRRRLNPWDEDTGEPRRH